MLGLKLCAEFAIFPDNHILGPNFTLAAFHFSQLGGPLMIANDTASERGLQFPDEGLEITLPIPSPTVEMRFGTFHSPVEISALDSSGKVVSKQTVPLLNKYIDLSISAREIAQLVLIGGGNEGLIPKICVDI